MKRSIDVLPLIVAVLCIASVGMAAATLTSADAIGAGEDDSPLFQPETASGDPDIDTNTTGEGQEGELPESENWQMTTCVEPLDSTPGTFGVIAGFLLLVGLINRRYNFSLALLSSWTLLPPVMFAYFMLTDCQGGGFGTPSDGGGMIGSAGETVVPVSSVPPWALGVLIGGVLLGAGVLLYRATGEDEVVVPEEDADDEPELDQFAEAAGRAADRIEEHNEDVDNSVYRAWLEMTSLLDVEQPDTYSAGEFADEAIALGMAEDDVSELTRLFNEVRYGGKDAASREDRAIDVLRNIESSYGTESDTETDIETETESETENEGDEQ